MSPDDIARHPPGACRGNGSHRELDRGLLFAPGMRKQDAGLRIRGAVLVALTSAAGCVGIIGGDDEEVVPPASEVAVSGLRRLTIDEYNNTLRDLLGDSSRPGVLLLPMDARTPFDNDYAEQVASQALVEGAELLAADASARLLAEPERRDTVV